MRIDISQGHFLALNKAGITLNCLYILESSLVRDKNEDLSNLNDRSSLSAIATLQRKGYMDLKLGVTQKGQELYNSLSEDILIVAKRDVVKDSDFELWWETYPASDEFEYKGKKFKGSQSKKVKKEECKLLFAKIVAEGISADKIIAATKYHVENAKSLSLRKGTNQVSFIFGSERYLRERCFVPFLGKVAKEEVIKTNETFI